MNANIKKLWIKALRSGEFKQYRGRLEKDGKYCALGVLSVLALLDGVCTYNEDKEGGRFDNKKFGLSFNVMVWAGLQNIYFENAGYVSLKVSGKKTTIAALNDSGATFSEIADIIEDAGEEI